QRMLEDMSMRRFLPDTQREYIRAVKRLATFLGRSPDTATAEELRAFQLHLTETGVQPPTINATVTALRFFFKVTLDRPETTRHVVFVYEPRKLPRVLSPEEVLRLLAAPGPKVLERSPAPRDISLPGRPLTSGSYPGPARPPPHPSRRTTAYCSAPRRVRLAARARGKSWCRPSRSPRLTSRPPPRQKPCFSWQ